MSSGEWTKYDERNIIDKVLAQRDADKRKADAQAEALAAEDAAVYNLNLIRKLEKRVNRLESDNMAQAKHIALLMELVERMGRDLDVHYADRVAHGEGSLDGYPYTVIGQREYDAAMHEAEGPDPTRESEGAWGHE